MNKSKNRNEIKNINESKEINESKYMNESDDANEDHIKVKDVNKKCNKVDEENRKHVVVNVMTKEWIKCTKNSFEVSCANIIFPVDGKMLQNPNVFVWDTAATCHSSFSDLGMSNVKDGANKLGIKAANGWVINPEKIGDVSGMVWSSNR